MDDRESMRPKFSCRPHSLLNHMMPSHSRLPRQSERLFSLEFLNTLIAVNQHYLKLHNPDSATKMTQKIGN